MRVMIISHTYITSVNRKKWQVLASLNPNVKLTVIFPSQWKSTLFQHKAEKNLSLSSLPNCKFIAIDIFKSGNEVLYSYKPIKLFKLIGSVKPDIIQVEQGDNALSYFQCILFAKMLRLNPKFIFFTWVNWKEKKSLKYKIFWNFIEKFNLKKSNAAIVGNNDAEIILKGKGFNKKILVLPQLGVDTDTFKPAQKNIIHYHIIGFVGRLVEEKGIFLLLQAFANLHKKYPNWKLTYLGTGSSKNILENQISLMKLNKIVEIKETITHEQVAEFMQNLDILVLPSFDTEKWREQFGHVLIEAMACKIPIIGSNAGEIPNIISNVGIIFKQKNTSSLQNSLEELILNEKLRETLSSKSYDLVLNKYSHKAIAKKTYNFWNEVVKGT